MIDQCDVLVVGAGPMGATTALALARLGVKVTLVNRYNWTATTPRAHITNQRAVEVLRDLGVEPDALREATPWELMGDTLFTTSLAGPEIARVRTWGTGEQRIGDYLQGSPCTMLDIPQDRMEPILVNHAAAAGARLDFNTEYLGHEQDADGVTVTLRDVHTGRERQVRTRYLVGADGARSKVLDDAGLKVEGQLARAGTAYVLFKADLTRYVAHRPSILYWIATSSAAFGEIGMGLLRAIVPWKRWIAGWGFDISKGEPDFSPEEVLRKVRILVGDPDLEIEVENTSVWYVNQASAPVYSKGRVFCGGDAVHRHPPSSGLGSNTCMQDAFNLAWKLAHVVKGTAKRSLLDTYSPERSAVGDMVLRNAGRMTDAAVTRNPLLQALRNTFVRMALSFPQLVHVMANTLSELNIAYPDSPLSKAGAHAAHSTRPGLRWPEVLNVGGRVPRFAAIGPAEVVADLCRRFPALVQPGRESRRGDLRDLVLVRPDGYVGFAGAASDAAGAASYLAAIAA